MYILPEPLMNATSALMKLSGVGEKTALRHVLSMTRWTPEKLQEFSEQILSLNELRHCDVCNMLTASDQCVICSDHHRSTAQSLCVVENVQDVIAIERSSAFDGYYFVLGGVLNPIMGIGPKELHLDKLKLMVAHFDIKTITLAVGTSVEGDATCNMIRELFDFAVAVNRIGFGMPIGGSLEHLDSLTISKAIENRRNV